ncbi:hypothetical protein CKO45_08510 [Paracraurococcus ruber]|uniref:Uncharacterized protein n=2 Tax=Paracraurococcus ruber TaxID=77675 RepID=A0ABS1CV41_9PROT|nr:hypothetical protein [Paracraurococcus ruber]
MSGTGTEGAGAAPALPAVTAAEAMLDAALAVSAGGMLHARAARPELRLESRDPRRFIVTTPWHEYSGDLSQGLVLQAIRGPAGRPGAPICHSGNLLEFRHRGRKVALDVEAHIVDYGLRRLPGRVVLFHESRFARREGLLGRRHPFARLRYDYAVLADSPVLELTVTLTVEPARRLVAPRLTTGVDALDPEDGPTRMRRLLAWGPAGRSAAMAAAGQAAAALHAGPAFHLALPEEPVAGDGPRQACHLRLLDGDRLMRVTGTPGRDGGLHWLVLRYACPTLAGGASVTLREERLRVTDAEVDPSPEAMDRAMETRIAAAMEAAARQPPDR